MTNEDQPEHPTQEESTAGERKLIEDRLAKAAQIRSKGLDPYPPRFDRTHTSVEATQLF